MNRLHLLGFTQDLKGVVFSQRRGGRTATSWIPIDAAFLTAIDKLERARAEAAESKGGKKKKGKAGSRAAAAEPPKRAEPGIGRSQMSSKLSPSEIQQLLREGRTIKSVVDASKAPQAWVERLMEPVLAERHGVIRLAQLSKMSRPRLGRSGLPVEEALIRNLEERRATSDTIEGLDDAWDARASRSGVWRVWVRFDHRGKRRSAEWDFRKNTRDVQPRNRLAAQLGWWPAEPGTAPAPDLTDALEGDDSSDEKTPPKARPRKPKRRASARRKTSPARKTKSRLSPARTKRSPTRKGRGKASGRRRAGRRS